MEVDAVSYLYVVATNKEVLVTVRAKELVRDEFKIACELRGATMSGLLHQFMVRTIREEKDAAPQAFVTRGVKATTVHLSQGHRSKRKAR